MSISITGIKAIVTDIEGTTGSIHFVHQVLFPYAGQHLPDYIRQHAATAAVAEQLDAARAEMGLPDADTEAVIQQLLQWISDDKKVTPLKALQGMVWEAGYRSGAFTGHVYSDAQQALKCWFEQQLRLFIYSSGSVFAQKLLFGYSDFGDLTPWFEDYFDTRIGGKREAASYQRILRQLDLPASEVLFLSDVAEELDAAAEAGMQTVQLVRDNSVMSGQHPTVQSFADIRIN